MLENNLYTITCAQTTETQIHTSTSFKKRKEPSQLNQTYLWHLRLGHVNLRRIQRLVSSGSL
ncbi:GAG-pre-integrase domain-containing protein, partial [Clostridioides difficile]